VSCGVIFSNYNGKEKARSIVKDDSFIGCNVNIVAPVALDELSYVAAGTTVTEDVPSGALAIGRSKQENKPGWVAKRNLIKKK
jgi:bifunctional UDP-N-acetylglucosamine pyrophosphorylase/glucosamine-1-phosphate N-acetyltransferase